MTNNYLFRHSILGITEMFSASTKGDAVGMLNAKTRGDHRSYFLEMVEFDNGGEIGGPFPVLVNEEVR